MTTVGTGGSNPYGDEAGLAPNFDYQRQQAVGAYNDALNQLNTKNNTLLQQYGFTKQNPSVSLDQALHDPNKASLFAAFSVDPSQQFGAYQQLQQGQGGILQQLHHANTLRGLGQFGMGANLEQMQRQGLDKQRTDLLSGYQQGADSVMQGGRDVLKGEGDSLQNIGQNQGNFTSWANTHYVSDGGNVADPIAKVTPVNEFSTLGSTVGDMFNNIPADKQAAGSQLGRIRDMLRSMQGTQGFDKAGYQKLVDQYTQALHKAGLLYYNKTWTLKGYDPTGHHNPNTPTKAATGPKGNVTVPKSGRPMNSITQAKHGRTVHTPGTNPHKQHKKRG